MLFVSVHFAGQTKTLHQTENHQRDVFTLGVHRCGKFHALFSIQTRTTIMTAVFGGDVQPVPSSAIFLPHA